MKRHHSFVSLFVAFTVLANSNIPAQSGRRDNADGIPSPGRPETEDVLAGYMATPFSKELLGTGKRPAARRALPSAYDWRDHGGCTPAKNQNPQAICWAFACVGDLESKVTLDKSPAEDPDYSEQDIWEGNAQGITGAGHTKIVANHLAVYGAILDDDNPYTNRDVPAEVPIPNYWNPPPGRPACTVTEWHELGDLDEVSDAPTLKQYIYDNGPVTVSIASSTIRFWYQWFSSPDWDSSTVIRYLSGAAVDHIVLIVGWDDDKLHDGGEGQGAWLVKNSWGSDWGTEAGCFWIAYGSANIGQKACFFAREGYKKYHSKEQLLYYDEFGCFGKWGYSDDYDAYGLCCFSPDFSDEESVYLKYVEFWAALPNMDYEIRVFDRFDRSGGGAASSQMGATVSGSLTDAGYYSIALGSPPRLSTGDEIAVQVRFTNRDADDYHVVPYERTQPWFTNPLKSESNVCFMSADGSNGSWSDISASVGDIGIRARIGPEGEEPDPPDEPVAGVGKWVLY